MHSTWTGYRFNLEQNTADNSSAGQVVIGPRLPVTDLMALDAVARLARELVAFDQRLEAEDLVITGGLTKTCAVEPGGQLVGVFSAGDAWSVEAAVRHN